MSYFQDTNNDLHWLDDDSFSYLLPAGCTQLTLEEAEAIQAAAIAALPPVANVGQFVADIKTALNGIVGANALASRYPLFYPAIQGSDWADVQALLVDALTNNVLNATEYAAIKASAVANNIPVTL